MTLAQRRRSSTWSAAIAPTQRDAAIAAALDVGIRIVDPNRVQSAVRAAAVQTSYPRIARWAPHDVAQGDAGLALLCGSLDACFPDAGWDARAHDLLASAARAAERIQPSPGLFSGLSGMGLVAQLLGRGGTRYQRLARAVDDALVPQVLALAGSVRDRRGGLAVGQFDAISGLAGIGAYLLARRDRDDVRRCLERLLDTLVEIVSTHDGQRARLVHAAAVAGRCHGRRRVPARSAELRPGARDPRAGRAHGAGAVGRRGPAGAAGRHRGRGQLARRAPLR